MKKQNQNFSDALILLLYYHFSKKVDNLRIHLSMFDEQLLLDNDLIINCKYEFSILKLEIVGFQ